MSEREPPGPSPEDKALSRLAFFKELDADLSTTEYAPSPPAPAPPSPPAPALAFKAWVELSVRFDGAPLEDLVAALFPRGLSLSAWTRLDGDYHRALSDDILADRRERPSFYVGKYQDELARRAGAPSASIETPTRRPGSWRSRPERTHMKAAWGPP